MNILGNQEPKDTGSNLLKKEKEELFGLFPPKEQYDSKLIMVNFELCRIHGRQ